MKRWAAVVIGLGMIVGTAVVAPAATAGTGLIATKGQPVIAMSDRTTCAVRETHRVYCWGANAQGELGRSDLATTQTVAPVNGVYDAIAVYGATTYSGEGGGFCALRINRTLVCWGDSESYRFGDGMWAAHDDATVISGMTNVATMSMGAAVTCVAKQDGTVWCVGGSSLVLPPAGSTTYRKIAGATSATAVAVGANFACFLKVDRTVW